MGTTNIISMIAQPVHLSYLCFEIGGIIDTCSVELGAVVNNISYEDLSATVKTGGTLAGDDSRLQFDSDGILQFAQAFSLATLRNGDRRASLDSAVNTRQNIYFSKYANSGSVISTIRANYSRTSPVSTPNLLKILDDVAEQQWGDLNEAYKEDDRLGVVKETSSHIQSRTTSVGKAHRMGKFYQESVARINRGRTHIPNNPAEGVNLETGEWWSHYTNALYKIIPAGTLPVQTSGVTFEQSDNNGSASGTQSEQHVDYEYKTPFHEARARHLRAKISLKDQRFDLFMFEQNIPHLEQIFKNELASVDNDVFQLQIALLRSFLISPRPGIVTGIYKNPGDSVNVGEPVIRVEDNAVVHIVANLVHYGPILIGATATLTTDMDGSAGGTTTLNGSVIAARVLGSGGHWEVIVKVNNLDGIGNFILPLGYYFDAEYTTVTIV